MVLASARAVASYNSCVTDLSHFHNRLEKNARSIDGLPGLFGVESAP